MFTCENVKWWHQIQLIYPHDYFIDDIGAGEIKVQRVFWFLRSYTTICQNTAFFKPENIMQFLFSLFNLVFGNDGQNDKNVTPFSAVNILPLGLSLSLFLVKCIM